MKKLFAVFILLLTSCINIQYPCKKTFQLDYIEEDETKHIFLNVIEIEKDTYKVVSQEFEDNDPDFIILDFFNYQNNESTRF